MSDQLKEIEDLYTSTEIYWSWALDLINKYWGKTSSLIYQHENWNHQYLHPFSIAEIKDKNVNNFTGSEDIFKEWEYPLLLRGSANWDQIWLIDLLQTRYFETWFSNFIDISDEMIIDSWSNLTREYAKKVDNIKHYQWLKSIIITPEIQNKYLWSIVDHPNIKDHFVLSLSRWNVQFLVNSKWQIQKESVSKFEKQADYVEKKICEIIEMKKNTDNAWFMKRGLCTQTEFALRDWAPFNTIFEGYDYNWEDYANANILFLQQRYFRSLNINNNISPNNYSFNTFWNKINSDDLPNVRVEQLSRFDKNTNFNLKISTDITDISNLLNIFKAIDSWYCKGIIFKKNWRWWWVWSLEHGCYRFIAWGRELDIETDE